MELGAVTGNVRSNRIAWESVCGGVVRGLKESGFPMRTKRLFISVVAALGLSALCLSAPASAGAPTASGAGHDQLAAADKSNFTAVRWGGGAAAATGAAAGVAANRNGYWGGAGAAVAGMAAMAAGACPSSAQASTALVRRLLVQHPHITTPNTMTTTEQAPSPMRACTSYLMVRHAAFIAVTSSTPGDAPGACATSVDQQPFTVTVPTEALAFGPWQFRSNFFTFTQ